METAAVEMEAVASQSKVDDPLYHLIVSWGPDERPTMEQVREALDAQLEALGFSGLQHVAAIHDDGEGGMVHLHAVINRVDPLSLRGRSTWRDRIKMREACREFELADGWRNVGEEPSLGAPVESEPSIAVGASSSDPYGVQDRFRRWVVDEIRPRLVAFLQQADATWDGVKAMLDEEGLRYEPVSQIGARIVGLVSGFGVRLADLGLDHSALLEKLGDWIGSTYPTRQARDDEMAGKVDSVRSVVESMDDSAGWTGVHEAFGQFGLGVEKRHNGLRVVELDGPGWQRIDRRDPILSIGALKERFGPYESSSDEQQRSQVRDAIRHAENLVVARRLEHDPSPIFTTLLNTRALVPFEDLQKDVERRVIDEQQRDAVLRSALSQMVAVDLDGRKMLTTPAVMEEERSTLRGARHLSQGRLNRRVTRDAGEHLDEQQRAAYKYATDSEGRLKVITGVPGAGKTTLLTEIAAGYEAAGYRVRALAVANSAVDVLRRETPIPARSVAKELYEWRREEETGGRSRARLTSRDVVFVDEVSTLGTEQGNALLSEAARAGATVIALGDDRQFQSVARGDALRLMQIAVGNRTIDLGETRRQRQPWQREATHAVRRGDVREALEAYRGRGFVRESKTQAEAREALVARWSELEADGVEVGIETYTNKERVALNGSARSAFRALGKLQGRDTILETMDGKTPYAIGERVVVRESIRSADLFNGSVVTVRGIRGAVLDVERRDGSVVAIDTREHPGLQHGYASTEFREQGSTRYAELQLLTRQVSQRSLTVGMTRHTDEFTVFYSREEFKRGFNAVVQLGERSQRKDLIIDGVERGRAQDVFGDRLVKGIERERASELEVAR
jgi:hypothetical protein